MTENKNCTLIKTKDLEALRELAENKKPDYIQINIFSNCYSSDPDFNTNLNLDDNLKQQILNMKRAALSIARDHYDKDLDRDVSRRIKDLAKHLLFSSKRSIKKQLIKLRDE